MFNLIDQISSYRDFVITWWGSWLRIVSLSPSITDVLVSIGASDSIVGVTPFCRPWLSKDIRELNIVGDYLRIRIDVLKKLRPDYVLLQSHVHDRLYSELRSKGFKAILIPLPESIPASLANIVFIGTLVGRGYEARSLTAKLMDQLYPVVKKSYQEPVTSRVKVYIEYLWPNWTFSTSGSLTFVNDEVWIARGINIFHSVINKFFTPSDEDVIHGKPELVLVNIEPGMKVNLSTYVKKREVIKELLKQGSKVRLIRESRNVNLTHWGPTALIPTIEFIRSLISTIKTLS